MANEIRTFTKEEQEEIFKLPKRKFSLGGETIMGHYKEETSEIFIVDENGNLTGKVGRPKAGAKRPGFRTESEETEKSSAVQAEDAKLKKKKIGFIVITAVVILGLGIAMVSLWSGSGARSTAAAKTETVELQTETGADTAMDEEGDIVSSGLVQVVSTTQDILAGDTLKENMFKEMSLTLQDYNIYNAVSGGVMLWEDMENLLGLKAAKYTPAFSYFPADAATVSADTQSNPFTVAKDTVLFTLSVDDVTDAEGGLTIGSVADLEITREVYDETGAGTDPAAAAEDVTIETNVVTEGTEPEAGVEETSIPVTGVQVDEAVSRTYTVNIYHLENVAVTDILNAAGESIYGYYAPYLDVPSAKQADLLADRVADEAFMDAVTPAYVVVGISETQAEAVGDTGGDSVELIVSGTLSDEYSGLADTSAVIRELMNTSNAEHIRYLEKLEDGFADTGNVITVVVDEAEDSETVNETDTVEER